MKPSKSQKLSALQGSNIHIKPAWAAETKWRVALLEYNMTAVGLSAIERAFRSIEGYATQHNQRMARMFGATPGGTLTPQHRVTNAAREAEQQYAPGRKEFVKQQELKFKEEQRLAKQSQQATEKAERAKVKATEKAEREKTRELERESKKRISEVQKEARMQVRAEERAAHEIEVIQKRHAANVRSGIRGGIAGAGKFAAGIGAMGLGLTGLAGGAIAANALHGQAQIDASASGLANQMVAAGASQEDIKKQQAEIVRRAHGVRGASSMDAIGAARAFGGISGSYAMGLDMAQDFTNIALATDVGLEDISRLAGNAYMKIKKPGMSDAEAKAQTLEAVRTFAGQGNIGAVEIKDLAEYGGRLTAAAAQFKGSRVENMAKMGTLAQVAVGSGSATDAAEATMAAARFASDLTEHAKDVSKLTIGGKNLSPFTDKTKTQFRSIDSLVADIMQATGGDMSKMKDIFGERSYKMAQGFQQIYLDAEKTEKGTGRQAVMDKFTEFMKAAVSETDVQTRAASRLSDADMQLQVAMKELNAEVAHHLMPAFVEMLPVIKDTIPALGEMTKAVVPFVELISEVIKYTDKLTGVAGSNAEEKRIQDYANGSVNLANIPDLGERLEAAEALLAKADKEFEGESFGQKIGAFFADTDSAGFRQWKEANRDVQDIKKQIEATGQSVEALKDNTKATRELAKKMGLPDNWSGGRGPLRPPRGGNGTPDEDI